MGVPDVIEKAALKIALESEVWPFLAHDPHDPERFWDQMADGIIYRMETTRGD